MRVRVHSHLYTSETSAFRTQTPGNYPKENILHKEHGESLKSTNSERGIIRVRSARASLRDLDVGS